MSIVYRVWLKPRSVESRHNTLHIRRQEFLGGNHSSNGQLNHGVVILIVSNETYQAISAKFTISSLVSVPLELPDRF